MKYPQINKFLLLSTLTISSYFLAQDVNDDFINSLPGSVKSDVLKEMAAAEEAVETYYTPDTSIEKPEVILKRLMQEMYSLEQRIQGENTNSNITLKRFGDLIFKSIQSSFMPINEVAANDNYILGPGDMVAIQLVGEINKTFEAYIRNDGSINLPSVGKYIIAGMQLDKADEFIRNAINQRLVGTESFLSLKELRDIQVLIVGNVESPGMYTLNGYSNALNALSVSGGISDSGSYRNISIKRQNKVISSFDLYEVFIFGNIPNDIYLKSGDSIVVGSIQKEVSIEGGVSNPAIYELKENETLQDLINFSGGLNLFVNEGKNEIRIKKNSRSGLDIFDAKSIPKNYSLTSGDSVFISYYKPINMSPKLVSITGNVENPGEYIIKDENTLSDLIKIAGGYSADAYPYGGIFIRESLKKAETEYNEKIYNGLVSFLTQNSEVIGDSGQSLQFLIGELKNQKPIGRLSTEFNLLKIKQDPNLDITLENGDDIFIPQQTDQIYILGEINQPGGRRYNADLSINEYITSAGGVTDFGSNKIIIIQPDGNSSSYTLRNGIGLNFNLNKISIYPGSLIYVPRDYKKLSGIELASTLSPIVSSIALSLASLNAINAN
tara:strand:- start:3080 stop:4906 length:1827 start_codon:yes stop_codon:yes gene_type:complete